MASPIRRSIAETLTEQSWRLPTRQGFRPSPSRWLNDPGPLWRPLLRRLPLCQALVVAMGALALVGAASPTPLLSYSTRKYD